MKRRQLIRHLEANGCKIFREGSSHSIYTNTNSGKKTAVPRHMEIDDLLARKICRQLEIPLIGKTNTENE